MLRTWLEDIIGHLKQLGSHADSLEDENRKLRADLASLLQARRDSDDTFTVLQWDPLAPPWLGMRSDPSRGVMDFSPESRREHAGSQSAPDGRCR